MLSYKNFAIVERRFYLQVKTHSSENLYLCDQCSKLTLVRRPMADNSSSGLTIFEKITLNSALMTDNILGINMNIEAFGPVG